MQTKKVVTLSAIIVAIIISSLCLGAIIGPRKPDFDLYSNSAELIKGESQQPSIPTTTALDEKLIIYSGYLTLEVIDISSSTTDLYSLTETMGGYVAGTQISAYGSRPTAYVTARIPKIRFQEAMAKFSVLGKPIEQRTSSEDITERYIDLKARLENLQRQETRLRELLSRTTTITEILAVEKELERIRGQIESLQGQKQYLERNTEMSLIRVQLTKTAPWFTLLGLDWGETLETAFRTFFVMLRGFIILVVSIGPFAVLGAITFLLYKRRKRWSRT
ncbi:MAG: DUF4349 domain-containing protein [archaeon]